MFGDSVTVLDNGNFVVSDPYAGDGAFGAVYLYSPVGELISTLSGASVGDLVGSGGIEELSNGNFVVVSVDWRNPVTGARNAGAVTWVNGDIGLSGVVSAANSLVGAQEYDQIGSSGVLPLENGNYVVASPSWKSDDFILVGAVTWGDGNIGVSGTVSSLNSLVGSSYADQVGHDGVQSLGNGNYVVSSSRWNRNGVWNAGAVTWVDGGEGLVGEVSPANSLVGRSEGDSVGYSGVTVLANGNYVVVSYFEGPSGSAYGAATWGNGSGGSAGEVSELNSLVGSSPGDFVGESGVVALENGNYVVLSARWDNGAVQDVGAATWANGNTGLVGAVSLANSFVGSSAYDEVGAFGAAALTNGNYVVRSPYWNNGDLEDAGAASFGNGTTGTTGTVAPENSLVGSSAFDRFGWHAAGLANGNYVVSSSFWDSDTSIDVGAVVWCDGSTGRSGQVGPANAMTGSSNGDGIVALASLSNGNYVVGSRYWDNDALVDVGLVSVVDGQGETVGPVSQSNSLVGAHADDRVGSAAMIALPNGSFVLRSPQVDDGFVANVGAVGWFPGNPEISGTVSSSNAMLGTSEGDAIGAYRIAVYGQDVYVFESLSWDNNGLQNAGAVTIARGNQPLLGSISDDNSVVGTIASAGPPNFSFDYDVHREQLVVGRIDENIVTLFQLPLFSSGFD